MVGMLQILTYLLCIYLVFKAYEIFQIAYVSTSDKREAAVRNGIILIVLSIIIAIGFALWADSQAESIGRSMRSLPQSLSSP
jgi:hypothetical protein